MVLILEEPTSITLGISGETRMAERTISSMEMRKPKPLYNQAMIHLGTNRIKPYPLQLQQVTFLSLIRRIDGGHEEIESLLAVIGS